LEGTASLEDLLARVAERAAATPPGEWIVGRGWIESRWTPPEFPTVADLDRAAPEHPVYLVRADGHAGVVNSAALREAGIGRQTPDPPGGAIARGPDGAPSGMLIDRAQQLVRARLPEESPERRREALVRGARFLAERGWTHVSIAGTSWEEIDEIERLIEAGEMPVRVFAAVGGPGPDADRLLDEGPRRRDDGMLTVGAIKLVMDGALGSRGAALLAPYADAPETSGLLMHEPETLRPLLERALRAGVQIQTHAIGDRANRLVLDLYEQAFAAVPPGKRRVAEPRWRIEHAQVLDPADIPRFAKLGVVASMQPSHAIGDLHFAPRRLGRERLRGAYAWRSLLGAGARIAAGSDAPVERGDPLVEFYAASVRKDLDGFSNEDWATEQRLSREEALRALTEWGAWTVFDEAERGRIAPGLRADFTVLSADPLAADEHEIPAIRVEMTVVGGRIVYDAGADGSASSGSSRR
jgi:predicted amidohydrolase YtcJ